MRTVSEKAGKYRWLIATLLLFSTTVNYMDRNVLGFLKDYLCSADGFGWTPSQFANLTATFTFFYALFQLFAGYVIDKVGTKRGLAYSLILWSIAGIASAFMPNALLAKNVSILGIVLPASLIFQCIVRSIFGAGEAGNFPSSIKAVAEWFPKKDRALATGFFNSGSNIGAMICALLVPWLLLRWKNGEEFGGIWHGWQLAFIVTGVVGFLWLIFWQIFYAHPKELLEKGKINQAEYDYIHSDNANDAAENTLPDNAPIKVSWGKMLAYRQTWSFAIGKFLTDGIWWFLLFWLPTFVSQQFGSADKAATAHKVMISNFVVFGIAIIGSIYGGAIPKTFMSRGWETYKARMTAMLVIAVCPLVLLLTTTFAHSLGIVAAVAVICIGAAAHQAWSANLFTTVSDMFPTAVVGTVTGIGAAIGGLGGVLVQKLAGYLDQIHAYNIMFGVCAFSYLLAWVVMKMLVPKHKPITDL
jgi:ACS family hexuronate transporter-like MFS transporter